MNKFRFLKYVGMAILGIGFITLAVFLTMNLWNWLIPALFKGPELSFWQTAGLFLLSKILLTGVAPGGHGRRHARDWRYRYNERRGYCHEEKAEATPQQA